MMTIFRTDYAVRHLFDDWSQVASRLRLAPVIAVFLDFDGTLTPLRARPEQVTLDREARQVLEDLARSTRFRMWVISGRRQADVSERVQVPGIRYLGLHGWEGRPGIGLDGETSRWLALLASCLKTGLADIPGIWIEDKQLALAIHSRGVTEEEDVRRAKWIVDEIVGPFAEQFRVASGKSVWEVLPRQFEDKGTAVRQQLASLPGSSIAVYVGDDQVDEPAFAALPDGITVRVGNGPNTLARYYLRDVAQVQDFLNKLRAEFA